MSKHPKPLGRKAYGSIPHLPGSRMGPGEHAITEGQLRILTQKARDRHDRIIATEKLDGANVAVAKVDGQVLSLGRAGYEASTSPYEHIQLFAAWVRERLSLFDELLDEGEALHGEWLAMAHGTKYRLIHDPFVAFDLTRNAKRVMHDELVERCESARIVTPRVLSDGPPYSLRDAVRDLVTSGHGVHPDDEVEGAVWRVERKGKTDFLAKWVRPTKIDGKYFEQISGKPAVWNWRPS